MRDFKEEITREREMKEMFRSEFKNDKNIATCTRVN